MNKTYNQKIYLLNIIFEQNSPSERDCQVHAKASEKCRFEVCIYVQYILFIYKYTYTLFNGSFDCAVREEKTTFGPETLLWSRILFNIRSIIFRL